MHRQLPKRATIRWQGYDYAQCGAYYLTIVTDDRRPLFGRIVDGVMHPSPTGELAQRCWDAIPQHMPHVDVGEFVVMPNHVHGIAVIRERLVVPVGADHDRPGIATDHDRPGIATDHDRPGIATDHDRPDTMPDHDTVHRSDSSPDVDATPRIIMPDTVNDVPNDHTANTPTAQPRADHDRPLRPPADADAPPKRTMPIVSVGSLGRIVRAYKSAVTRMAYRDGLLPHGTPVWQRNYWDHVIRDGAEHERIAKYIRENPANWKGDRFNR